MTIAIFLCYSKIIASNENRKNYRNAQPRSLFLFLVYLGSPEVNPVFAGNRWRTVA
ncbi:MAG: hypothetical protein MUD14_07625 [Hydrococcus sp. Prado102]|nr:hypothetical protein [Hydrococcus sp. Prado102]